MNPWTFTIDEPGLVARRQISRGVPCQNSMQVLDQVFFGLARLLAGTR
jgi:hypothetical protein